MVSENSKILRKMERTPQKSRSLHQKKCLSQKLPFNCDMRSLNNCSRTWGAVVIWKAQQNQNWNTDQ